MKHMLRWSAAGAAFILAVSAAAQVNNPCGAVANVAGWTVDLSVTASGTSYSPPDSSEPNYKYTVARSASTKIVLDQYRSQSAIFGPNGEVLEISYDGRATSSVQVNDKIYSRDTSGWRFSASRQGSGDVSPLYDTPLNSSIVFHPGLNGTCFAFIEFPTTIDVTYSDADNNGNWTSALLPYSWATASSLAFAAGKTSIVPTGSDTSIWDWLSGYADPTAVPQGFDRTLTIHDLSYTGALVDWTFKWHFEPILPCGCNCSPAISANRRAQPFVAAPSASAVTITASDPLWWFNGETPDGFRTVITLSAAPATNCTYEWTIETGGSVAAFISPSKTASIQLKSLRFSHTAGDVKIRVKRNEVPSDLFPVTVRAPFALSPGNAEDAVPINLPDPYYGYITYIPYQVVDQFKKSITQDIPLSENLGAHVPRWAGPGPVTGGWLVNDSGTGGYVAPKGAFSDHVSGGGGAATSPVAIWRPLDSAVSNLVTDLDQIISAGSEVASKGVPIQYDRNQHFQDHGAHTAIVSPILPK